MARKKQRTNWKLALAFKDLQAVAPKILAISKFSALITSDCELQASSGIWEKANRTLTARLVNRTEVGSSLVLTVGGLPLAAARPDAPVVVNG
jgi:hypothetical protein